MPNKAQESVPGIEVRREDVIHIGQDLKSRNDSVKGDVRHLAD